MEFVLGGLMFTIGIAIGTSLPFWVGLIFLVILLYWLSNYEGLDGVIPTIFATIITFGLITGNISYLIQTDTFPSISNPFIVEVQK